MTASRGLWVQARSFAGNVTAMYLVAIAELTCALEPSKLSAVAEAVGTTAYELRLLLNAGLPAVVQVTTDDAQAKAIHAAIVALGLRAIRCDSSVAVASTHLTTLRQFELTPTHLVPDQGAQESCAYTEIAALLRATQRSTRETVETVKERKFQPVMAVATGGLVMSKKTTKDVTTTTSSREQVLYIFRHGGLAPWILKERAASYTCLKAEMAPTSFENFSKTIAKLRLLAPGAAYDERLMTSRPIRGIGEGQKSTDLQAYLLAECLCGPRS